jgi:anti-anti-sigma factor
MYQVAYVDVPQKDNLKIIYLSGEIDGSNFEDFRRESDEIVKSTEDVADFYILHLRDLEFINSTVIGYLADMYTKLGEKNKKIILAEGNDHILDILDLVGFLNLVEHYSSLKEAITSTEL